MGGHVAGRDPQTRLVAFKKSGAAHFPFYLDGIAKSAIANCLGRELAAARRYGSLRPFG